MMIEKIIFDYLSSALSVPVYMEIPPDPADSYVVVEKTGSGIEDQIKNATIVIQSVASSLYEAATLNETVKTKMEGLITLSSISRCKLNSDYNFSDPETKAYRYQAVFDIVHY